MSFLRVCVRVALCLVPAAPVSTMAAQQVGEAVLIKTEVTGASGPLTVNGPVHRDERIRTSKSGLGQFVFLDGTKLAVGWGSSVVIDKFVFDDTKSLKKLTIKASKGTFRWISGGSKSSVYEIVTPAGTIGVRGTAFDVDIMPDGTTVVVLLNGSARFCGANGCRQLKRRCDAVIATPNGGLTDPRRVSRSIFKTLGTSRALPFLSGNQRLSAGFGVFGASCGLSVASLAKEGTSRDRRSPESDHEPAVPDPDPPDKPDPPDRPDPPEPDPDPPTPDPDPPTPDPDPPGPDPDPGPEPGPNPEPGPEPGPGPDPGPDPDPGDGDGDGRGGGANAR